MATNVHRVHTSGNTLNSSTFKRSMCELSRTFTIGIDTNIILKSWPIIEKNNTQHLKADLISKLNQNSAKLIVIPTEEWNYVLLVHFTIFII